MFVLFSKYSGLGNDFIFIDHRQKEFLFTREQIQYLCDRHEGIGADGVVFVEPSNQADARMRIFNSDGSEAEMCGNALRCLYPYLKELGFSKETFLIQTHEKRLKISRQGEDICCEMGSVSSIEWGIDLTLNQRSLKGHFLHTGVPHVVIPVQDLHHFPVLPFGQFVRHHPKFQPQGTNVNFIHLNAQGILEVRTYERGVENETQACGTGCAAAAIVGQTLFNLTCPIQVQTALGKVLKFNFERDQGRIQNLEMLGPAHKTFEGRIDLVSNSQAFHDEKSPALR